MKIRSVVAAVAAVVLLGTGAGALPADAAPPQEPPGQVVSREAIQKNYERKAAKEEEKADKRVTQTKRDEAAARALQDGAMNPLMTGVTAAAAAAPGDAPRYFSHPNYANSPLPQLTSTPGVSTYVGNPLQDRQYATDSATTVFGMLPTDLPAGTLSGFQVWNQYDADPALASAGKQFHAYLLRPTGTPDEYAVVFDSGALTMPVLSTEAPTTSAAVTFAVANLAVQAGDRLAWYGQGIPLDIGGGGDYVSYPAPTKPLQGTAITLGSAEFPTYSQDRTYSYGADVVGPDQTVIEGGMRKFVDPLPDIQTAVPDTTTYPGADYYEIGLVEYEHQFHADLPPTKVRGYVQLNGPGGAAEPSHLGPAIRRPRTARCGSCSRTSCRPGPVATCSCRSTPP